MEDPQGPASLVFCPIMQLELQRPECVRDSKQITVLSRSQVQRQALEVPKQMPELTPAVVTGGASMWVENLHITLAGREKHGQGQGQSLSFVNIVLKSLQAANYEQGRQFSDV